MIRLVSGTMLGLLSTASIGAVLMISAGTWAWREAWILVAIFLMYYATMFTWGIYGRPSVLYERAGTIENLERGWDKLILGLYFVSSYVLYTLAGLDHRRFQGEQMGAVSGWVGIFMVVAAFVIPAWAIASNPFASGAARVQTERGHEVVETGPYRFIRHPIYLGSLMYGLGLPLMLDSWKAMLPGLVIAAAFVMRTLLEDNMLRAELPGYVEYTRRVPHKLLPGIW